jgi:hypothetical protein
MIDRLPRARRRQFLSSGKNGPWHNDPNVEMLNRELSRLRTGHRRDSPRLVAPAAQSGLRAVRALGVVVAANSLDLRTRDSLPTPPGR